MKIKAKFMPGKSIHRWLLARKLIQYGSLVAVVIFLILTRGKSLSPETSNAVLRLDPLVILAQSLANRTFLAGSALVISTILLTLLFGRVWCGWLCPLGTVLDLFPLRRHHERQPDRPESWRNAKYLLLVAILIAALLTNLSLLIFDPLTIFVRTFTTSFWPAVDSLFTNLEGIFGSIPWADSLVYQLDSIVRPAFLPMAPSLYRYALVYGIIFTGIIALNRIAPRFWCRYLCPLGGLLGWISKAALFRREVTGECKDCKLCSRTCPTGTIRPEKGYSSDPSECTVCLECLGSCRLQGNAFTLQTRPSRWNSYDPSRRQVLGIFGLSLGAVALAQSEPTQRKPDPNFIQPPGALDNELLTKCIRCGECIRTCPTSGLQPALYEAGVTGLFTPILIPRLGYCDYACNACGQVCPVEAIPPLNLEEKRQTVIGHAYIDENRCVAWADHRDCIVCEEMCPLPEKAVKLLPTDIPLPGGATVKVKLPYVDRSLCIGCGICEYKCPVNGPAAIQVYVPGQQA